MNYFQVPLTHVSILRWHTPLLFFTLHWPPRREALPKHHTRPALRCEHDGRIAATVARCPVRPLLTEGKELLGGDVAPVRRDRRHRDTIATHPAAPHALNACRAAPQIHQSRSRRGSAYRSLYGARCCVESQLRLGNRLVAGAPATHSGLQQDGASDLARLPAEHCRAAPALQAHPRPVLPLHFLPHSRDPSVSHPPPGGLLDPHGGPELPREKPQHVTPLFVPPPRFLYPPGIA